MSRVGIFALVLVLLIALGAGGVVYYARTQGFSATAQPSRPEKFIAHRLLSLSYPASAKTLNNPLQATTDNVEAGRQHYKHDCAVCHGDDGLGKTEIGQGMYPKPPNLQREANLSDGELFYIIRNGVRFTGMPGWRDPDEEIWQDVLYIRSLGQKAAGQQAAVNKP